MIKVLVAEDNLMLADVLEEYLMGEGFEVYLASTVDEAVALADLHKPDLAVLDYRLGDGGLGSQIRARIKDKAMGIIFVSGDTLGHKLTRADGEAYIQKPYSMYALTEALRIVQKIMNNEKIIPSRFPEGFCLLPDATDTGRKIA